SFVKETFAHWQAQNVKITAALVGYIDNLATGEALYQYLKQAELDLVVIDPVFADEGKFYPNLDERHLALQKKLLQVADFATPNLTEAKFLTGQMQNDPDLAKLAHEVERLLRPGGRAVITGVELDGQKGCIWLEDGQLKTCVLPKVTGHFYGSGDVFAALLASFLRQKVPFEQAIKQATGLTQQALIQTADQNVDRSYGIYLGELLPQLAKGISHED
ncbi:PfkB family carbohydrate kinase, partial [Ligilactobacillus animalis]